MDDSNIKTNNFLRIFLILGLLFIVYQVSMLSVHGTQGVQFGIITILSLFLVSFLFWKKAILFFIFWVLISGAVRKWLLPGSSDIVYLYGYAILGGIYVRYFKERFETHSRLFIAHPVNVYILFLFIWGLACMLNPQLPNPLVGILGLVIYFYFIPLAFILPYAFDTKEQLLKFLRIFAFASIPFLVLGVIQFFSPIDHPINIYVGEISIEDIALAGNKPRVTSTFSYISGFSGYLSLLIILVVYLLSIKTRQLLIAILLYLIFAFSVLCLLMTGSRGPTAFALLGGLIYLLLGGIFNLHTFKRALPALIISAAILFALVNFTSIGKSVLESFMTRASSSEDIVPRLLNTYIAPFRFFKEAGVFGLGIGRTYQGSVALGNNPFALWDVVGGYEEEQGRIVVEIGFVGYVLTFFVRILLVLYFWKLYRKLNDENLRLLALASMVFLLPFSIGVANLVFDHTSNILYWYVVGFLFLLPKLDEQRK